MLRACPRAVVEVIPHGVQANLFRHKISYRPVARRFVTIARLVPWKRIAMVIEAVIELRKTLTDVTLTIYGDGELRVQLDALIRESGASGYVALMGFVPKEALFAGTLQPTMHSSCHRFRKRSAWFFSKQCRLVFRSSDLISVGQLTSSRPG